MKGAYCLLFFLDRDRRIRVGALGAIDFPRGIYAYVGSAQSGVRKRVDRHVRREKKTRWHIDYLLEHAEIISSIVVSTERKDDECEITAALLQLEGSEVVAPGFGSSDCGCSSHLIFFGDEDLERVAEDVAMSVGLLPCAYPKSV